MSDDHVSPVQWSVHAVGRRDGVILSENPDLALRSASTAKILVLLAAAAAMDAGALPPAEQLDRRDVDPVADSGIWQHLDTDALPAHDVATLVGAVSDNLATNVLLRRLGGVDRVAEVAAGWGIGDVALHDIVRDERTSAHPPTLSTGSARGYVALLSRIAASDGISPAVTARVLGWLRGGADLSMAASAFGLDPLAHTTADRGIALANKTGTDAGVRADAGVLWAGDDVIVYACLANWGAEGADRRDEVLQRMRSIGRELRAAATAAS